MTPAINFKQETRELLARYFGFNKPFVVVRKDTILENDKPFGERIYFSNGPTLITVPNIQGLSLGDMYYIGEDHEVYEWQKHFDVAQSTCTNNQTEALAFGLHPIVHHKDSRNS